MLRTTTTRHINVSSEGSMTFHVPSQKSDRLLAKNSRQPMRHQEGFWSSPAGTLRESTRRMRRPAVVELRGERLECRRRALPPQLLHVLEQVDIGSQRGERAEQERTIAL